MPLSPATRYTHPGLGISDDPDFTRLLCRECSTRTRIVIIPADERDDHNAWHDMPEDANDRHAVIKGKGHADLETVRRYLPHNYWADSDGGNIWIHGYDNAGWTLDGYVIPRLESGLWFATEVTI